VLSQQDVKKRRKKRIAKPAKLLESMDLLDKNKYALIAKKPVSEASMPEKKLVASNPYLFIYIN